MAMPPTVPTPSTAAMAVTLWIARASSQREASKNYGEGDDGTDETPREGGSSVALGRRRRQSWSMRLCCLVLRSLGYAVMGIMILFGLYFAAASPPLHWWYEVAPHAGPASVYLPGGGFSGFWFHLGYLHSIPTQDLHDYDYYCFSAGCLSILSVFMNRSLDEVSEAAFAAQRSWTSGHQSRFELVESFFDDLVPPHLDLNVTAVVNLEDATASSFLPRIKVLVTTFSDGFRVEEAQTREELRDLIVKTTWVPYLTGWGFSADEREVFLDGGFSRLLHPTCETELHLPLIWETLIHTFSPGLTRNQVNSLWNAGHTYNYKLPKKKTTNDRRRAAQRSPSHSPSVLQDDGDVSSRPQVLNA